MKARVLYTAFDVVPSPKGASTHIVHFIRGLVNGGYDVQLMTPGDGLLPAVDQLEGASVRRAPVSQGGNFLVRALEFGKAIQEHIDEVYAGDEPAYDVVHYRSIWGGLQLAQSRHRYGYRTIFEVNGLPSVELKYHYPALRDSDLLNKIREQELATLHMSEVIICPSDVTRTFLVSLGVARNRITVIPNGVSLTDFSDTPLPPASDERLPSILYVGTLADWQGLEILIQAMPAILSNRPAMLHIVGQGRSRQRKTLNKLVHKLGVEANVIIEPAQPHHTIARRIAEAYVCVAPLGMNDRNIVQGCCPIKILEYMAAGRPLVASNLPVVRELVRENVDGLLFWPDDTQDLAAKILAVLNNRSLAQHLVENASQRVRQHFTWRHAQKRLLSAYNSVLAPGLTRSR